MRDTKTSLQTLFKAATPTEDSFTISNKKVNNDKEKPSKLYMQQYFNVKAFYPGLAVRGICRMTYPLVEALNTRGRIPKYIIIIPDKDIIYSLQDKKIESSIVMGAAIHYIMRRFDTLLERRRVDLIDKKTGCCPP